jgi:capsular polysaccharide biosynthesis protein
MSDYLPVDEPLGGQGGETQPSRRYMGQFVSLRYVAKALSRRRSLWITLAVAGLLVGMSLHAVIPPKYTAQTTILLAHNPNDDAANDMATDVALLQSEIVAKEVVTALKLDISPEKFVGEYAGVAVTDDVLQITMSAPTSAEAVTRADAVAKKFLSFRNSVYGNQNNGVVNALMDELKVAQRQGNTAQVNSLEAQIQSDNAIIAAITTGSYVISPANAATHSKLKVFVADGASGLVAGLGLGLGIVAVSSIVSDRIRRRDEVASALGAPVELSVGKVGRSRFMRKRRLSSRLSRPGRAVELMSRQLRTVVQTDPRPKRLAVVSVDSLEASALSLAILAGRLAVFEGSRVMVMDLSPGRILGQLLGVSKPETRVVFVKGAWVPVLVSVPAEDDLSVEMPAHDDTDDLPGPSWTTPQVVLVLATLDPGTGAGYLKSVADEAVVIVTAGRSNAATVRGTAEMLRAAGISVRGGILVGADRNDDSLGYAAGVQTSRSVPGDLDDLMETSYAAAGAAENH